MMKALLLVTTLLLSCHQNPNKNTHLTNPSGSEIPVPKAKYTAAFLLADGTLPLDYAGAYEVLGQARMRVMTIGKTLDTIKLSSNMQVIPNFSIDNTPEFNILVIPSSFEEDTSVINWIKQRAERTDYILTICGGVIPVYDAGLLDGKTITSYGPLIDHTRERAKNANVVADKRFVDNDNIITCGSYASGIDGALYLVSKIYGEPRAQEVANNIEYNWDKEYKYVRAKLADNWLAPLYDFNPPLRGRTLKYEGDEARWTAVYETTRSEPFEDFHSQISEMAAMHRWENQDSRSTDTDYYSKWTRKDFNDHDLTCTVMIKKLTGTTTDYLVTYTIQVAE